MLHLLKPNAHLGKRAKYSDVIDGLSIQIYNQHWKIIVVSRTYQPHKKGMHTTHGFRKRMRKKGGRSVLSRRRKKGRHKLAGYLLGKNTYSILFSLHVDFSFRHYLVALAGLSIPARALPKERSVCMGLKRGFWLQADASRPVDRNK